MLEFDAVSKPSHYADKEIEVIDYMRDTLTAEGFEGYCVGNVLKYVSRYKKKGGAEDLAKAKTYLQWALEVAKEREQKCPAEKQIDFLYDTHMITDYERIDLKRQLNGQSPLFAKGVRLEADSHPWVRGDDAHEMIRVPRKEPLKEKSKTSITVEVDIEMSPKSKRMIKRWARQLRSLEQRTERLSIRQRKTHEHH